jgi:hypothetical protein
LREQSECCECDCANSQSVANAIARTVRVLRDESGVELHGEEEWRRMLGREA